MSLKIILGSILFIFFLSSIPAYAQQKEERQQHKVSCFNKKVEVFLTHPTRGENNGKIRVVLPENNASQKLQWVHGLGTIDGGNIKNLGPDFYHLIITDPENRCQDFVRNIQLKETPRDE